MEETKQQVDKPQKKSQRGIKSWNHGKIIIEFEEPSGQFITG
jgi:hypothetical protein